MNELHGIATFLAGMVAMTLLLIFSGELDINIAAQEVIEQCEAELPRNQSCEVVITARVKEGE